MFTTCTSFAPQIAIRCRRGCGRGGSARASITLCRCTYSRPMRDGCRSVRRAAWQTERAAAEVLSLPLYPELTDEQVTVVCRAIDCLTD